MNCSQRVAAWRERERERCITTIEMCAALKGKEFVIAQLISTIAFGLVPSK